MPMSVVITLTGDAIIYKRSKYWNIVLVTDQHHTAILSDNRGIEPPDPLRNSKIQELQLQIKIAKLSTKTLTEGSRFEQILNIGRPALHQGKLKVDSNPASGRELIQLRIPVGEVDADARDQANGYWYETHSGNPNPGAPAGQIPGPIATKAKVAFAVEDPGGPVPAITLEDTKGNVIRKWRFDSSQVLEISIANDCAPGAGGFEDFLHFYDWVSDKRDKPATPGNAAVKHRFTAGKLHRKGKTKVLSRDGNCDPVVIVPPPPGPDPEFP